MYCISYILFVLRERLPELKDFFLSPARPVNGPVIHNQTEAFGYVEDSVTHGNYVGCYIYTSVVEDLR